MWLTSRARTNNKTALRGATGVIQPGFSPRAIHGHGAYVRANPVLPVTSALNATMDIANWPNIDIATRAKPKAQIFHTFFVPHTSKSAVSHHTWLDRLAPHKSQLTYC